MVKLLDLDSQKLAKKLIDDDKIIYTKDAEKDILRWKI